jgi:hypothetical protein
VDTQRVITSLTSDPVTPLDPTGLGHIWVATHSDPEDTQSLQRSGEARLRSLPIEEHLVSDEMVPSASNSGEALVPGCLCLVEYLSNNDGTVRFEMD